MAIKQESYIVSKGGIKVDTDDINQIVSIKTHQDTINCDLCAIRTVKPCEAEVKVSSNIYRANVISASMMNCIFFQDLTRVKKLQALNRVNELEN